VVLEAAAGILAVVPPQAEDMGQASSPFNIAVIYSRRQRIIDGVNAGLNECHRTYFS
jgi:hypothetical protein